MVRHDQIRAAGNRLTDGLGYAVDDEMHPTDRCVRLADDESDAVPVVCPGGWVPIIEQGHEVGDDELIDPFGDIAAGTAHVATLPAGRRVLIDVPVHLSLPPRTATAKISGPAARLAHRARCAMGTRVPSPHHFPAGGT